MTGGRYYDEDADRRAQAAHFLVGWLSAPMTDEDLDEAADRLDRPDGSASERQRVIREEAARNLRALRRPDRRARA